MEALYLVCGVRRSQLMRNTLDGCGTLLFRFRMSPRFLSCAFLALSLIALAGCPRRSAIWLLGQEAPGRPVFGVGETPHGRPTWLGHLIVVPCDRFDGTARNALWFIVQDTGAVRVLDRVVYGKVPTGYIVTHYKSEESSRTAVSPPLTAGCYVASISGTGRVRFRIGEAGSALEIPWR